MSGQGCTVVFGYPLLSSMRASFLTPDAVYDGTRWGFLKSYLKQKDVDWVRVQGGCGMLSSSLILRGDHP
jgi:hypothetical protein